MRLKRVRVFGFKTFADRTEFNLDGGIIAVVGPNGCGKSNLVDAILWALGESNSRHLRALASQDVIFSGSARRKPVGFAEVSLLFDNEDGLLPIDTSEVTITRRLNRAGESDYFINRRSCRQRDVHELLADSGLGRAGYAIVSQKEIDQALAASPEDRRAWVDEAAGVQRYRVRKTESVKKLASAREHLTRVDDILRELDVQREPLREEAEVAFKYKAAVGALRQVETGLLVLEVANAAKEIAELETRLASSGELVRAESQRAEELDEEANAIRVQVAEIEHRMEGFRIRLQDSLTAIERAQSGIELSQQRRDSLGELEQTLLSGDDSALIMEAEAELRECDREALADEARLLKAREAVGGAGIEPADLAEQLTLADAELARAALTEAESLRRQAETDHREERRRLAEREIAGIEKDLPTLAEARDEALADLHAKEDTLSKIQSEEAKAHEEEGKLRNEVEALSAESRSKLAEKAALEGRQRGIEATIAAHECLAQGTRAILDAAGKGDLKGRYIPVGEAIQSERRHALAIETALGGAANDLIVEHESEAKEAIRYLKEGRLGRATFQPVPLMRPSEPSGELRRLTREPGVVGRASELVQYDTAYRPVIDSLLGRVLVVEDLDASLRLAKERGFSKLVTLGGEVVHASGAVTGGEGAKQQYGLVQRKADLIQIARELDALTRSLAILEVRIEETTRLREERQSRAAELGREASEAGHEIAEAKQFLHTLNTELQAAMKAREKLAVELKTVLVEIAPIEKFDLKALQSKRDGLMTELATRSADAGQAKARLEEAELRLAQAKQRRAAAQRRLDSAQQGEASRAKRLENLGPERERLAREIERHEKEKASAEGRRKHLEADLREAQSGKDRLLSEGVAKAEEAKDKRANISAMAAGNHQAELHRARAEAKRATAAERLLEEYGVSDEEALLQAPGVELPPDAQPVANRLRKEIRGMGSVNVGAIEAYERLASRHEELSAQRDDIVEGIEQVQASMHELDKLTRDKFLESFAKVQEAYAEIFQKLFEGGEGRIFLDQPDSILDSGIEIEVTLPGKKRQRLELLSGGERALCASGFLFALLQVKPAPLVVLDEVDAPLDGRNVERFADVLQEFTDRTQFILITHNPTTIERAPIWLGVTMQEPGVSTLVPARLPVAHAS